MYFVKPIILYNMSIMRKKKSLLDEIKDKYIYSQDKACEMFLRMVWDYYVKNDLETGDQLADIFYALYMNSEKLTYDEIVYRFNIGLSTLSRYRKRFNKLANILLPNK